MKCQCKAIMSYSPQKKRMIQLVHIGKSQLGLDDGTYRHILAQVTGKNSSKECSALELKKVVEHMELCGFKIKPGKKHTTKKPDAAKAKRALINKIEALLAHNGWSWAYAEAIAKQMYKVDALTFCSNKQLRGVITALTKRAQKLVDENSPESQSEVEA